MTKKHFEAIATILGRAISGDDSTDHVIARDRIAEDIAEYFAAENPRFNRARFLRAVRERTIGSEVSE